MIAPGPVPVPPLDADGVRASAGRLVYLMGASGSGKDTILRGVRASLSPADGVKIATRFITRAPSADEPSIELTTEAFARLRDQGAFALCWESHGLGYGIGTEIDGWLARGSTVIINGSRHHAGAAYVRYPDMLAVEIAVDSDVLRRRLTARARESAEAIAQRLARAVAPYDCPLGLRVVTLDNNGPAGRAVGALIDLARHAQGAQGARGA
ncbi:phosphonate metabolism protein/1,5-bisphosphokinase (PRPP-forming) PhnN [Schauerella aestuarii]|uniref:phosphonate metabolism protein/1,5-bisphosphokinase (PRPP-forming) PhnN n=1 Tax=Schauerella aestuarii TaxID=2511204 RepID=UPI001369B8CB|nr:phosphonate metabolism protein/1,5-bisphosphokinase (PRPP-forming) PhnN [Achromobacter aestuarii]MYZ44692.1 phosphonate metabolism protein/1,5-bisphosphokinase (PRPP-forming) PhnN [Achromobacter aestuarii]